MPKFAITVACQIFKRIEVEAEDFDDAVTQAEELAWEPSESDVYDSCEYIDGEELPE